MCMVRCYCLDYSFSDHCLLAAFVQMLCNYRETPVRSHLAALYDTLLEQVVEIEYIAQQARAVRR
jgi:hypothetical protein